MRLDAWYAYYHHHWWCRRRQFTHFKRAHLWWNGLALLLDCGSSLEKQLGGGRISRRQYVGQRLDRILKLGHLGATESVCLYDLCQNLDRIANLCTQRRRREPGGFFGQDANLGRHGDGFCATLDRHLSEGLRGPVSLSPSSFYKSDRDLGGANHTSMPTGRRRRHCLKGRQGRRRRPRQQGGVIPLLALLAPALAAAGKAAALGTLGGAAGYAAKRGLAAATRRRRG